MFIEAVIVSKSLIALWYLQKDANAFITELSSIANTLGTDLWTRSHSTRPHLFEGPSATRG